jgi:type IV secretory pathway TrbD component
MDVLRQWSRSESAERRQQMADLETRCGRRFADTEQERASVEQEQVRNGARGIAIILAGVVIALVPASAAPAGLWIVAMIGFGVWVCREAWGDLVRARSL